MVAEECFQNPVERDGEERAAADVGGESFGEKSQREDAPEGIESHEVQECGFCGTAHSEERGLHALDDGEGDAAQHHQKEEVLQGNLKEWSFHSLKDL